jgi:hypothetical protein
LPTICGNAVATMVTSTAAMNSASITQPRTTGRRERVPIIEPGRWPRPNS